VDMFFSFLIWFLWWQCDDLFQVTYTMDIRAIDDLGREAVIYDLSNRIYQICDKRSVSCLIEHKVWPCQSWLDIFLSLKRTFLCRLIIEFNQWLFCVHLSMMQVLWFVILN
jgi:hypothetical protein